MRTKQKYVFTLLSFYVLFTGCTEVLQILNQASVQKPDASISKMQLQALSFSKADLMFDIEISNPNNVSVSMAGFDYDLQLNERSFLTGTQDETVQVAANGTATVQFPVSLVFQDIYSTYNNLKDADSVAYTLNTGLSFNVPVLGKVRVPLSKSGTVPNIQMPKIAFQSLKLDKLNFGGADMVLAVKIDNPNAWGVDLEHLDMQLEVNGLSWMSSSIEQTNRLAARGESTINIPFSLNFMDMGRSVMTLLSGDPTLNYSLNGTAGMNSSLPLLGEFELPINKSGTTKLIK